MTIDRTPPTWGATFLAFYMHNLTSPAKREFRDPFAQACQSADRVMERFEQLAERDRRGSDIKGHQRTPNEQR